MIINRIARTIIVFSIKFFFSWHNTIKLCHVFPCNNFKETQCFSCLFSVLLFTPTSKQYYLRRLLLQCFLRVFGASRVMAWHVQTLRKLVPSLLYFLFLVYSKFQAKFLNLSCLLLQSFFKVFVHAKKSQMLLICDGYIQNNLTGLIYKHKMSSCKF